MIEQTCNSLLLIGVLSVVRRVMLLIQIIAPITLIVAATIEFTKLVKNPDEKNGLKKVFNKFIAALVIFLIPVMVDVVINMIGFDSQFSICWKKASKTVPMSTNYAEIKDDKVKKIFTNPDDYEAGVSKTKLNSSNAVEIPDSIISKAKYSDLSIIVTDDTGKVLAQRKPDVLREGGSTTKVFTGYAAVSLLDPESDTVPCTQYAQNMPYMGTPDVTVGKVFSVATAATKDFPGSSNITTANIAIAIGKKFYTCTSDEEAYMKGMDVINYFLPKQGCTKTKLVSSSGVNYNYNKKRWGEFDSNGISKGEYGITASDLALVTIAAMKNEYFASGIKNRNNNGLFFIKSGTQAYKHGVWGFNHNNKRYYIVALGFNFKKEGDVRNSVSKSIYNWTVANFL